MTQKRLAQYEIVFICVCQQRADEETYINKGTYTHFPPFLPRRLQPQRKMYMQKSTVALLASPRRIQFLPEIKTRLSFSLALNNVYFVRAEACG